MGSTGDAIRRAREALGLSRRDLGAAAGVSERTVNRVEAGERTSARSVEPLLRYLKLGEYSADTGPSLRDASHAQLIAELARRLDDSHTTDRSYPQLPQTEVTWQRSDAPSARRSRQHSDDESGPKRSTQ